MYNYACKRTVPQQRVNGLARSVRAPRCLRDEVKMDCPSESGLLLGQVRGLFWFFSQTEKNLIFRFIKIEKKTMVPLKVVFLWPLGESLLLG